MTLWADFLKRLMLSASLSGAAAEPPAEPPADPPVAEVGEPSGGGAAVSDPAPGMRSLAGTTEDNRGDGSPSLA